MTSPELEQKIKELQKELAQQLKIEAQKESWTAGMQIAALLREKVYTRLDDSWWYEVTGGFHDWNSPAHVHMCNRARTLMATQVLPEDIIKVLRAL